MTVLVYLSYKDEVMAHELETLIVNELLVKLYTLLSEAEPQHYQKVRYSN